MTESTDSVAFQAPADVFISYSRADSDRVLELVNVLRERGVTVWLDQGDIAGGSRWREEIVKGITGCKVFLFVASSSSFGSDNVSRELSIASEENKVILPIMLEPVEVPPSHRYQLSEHQWLSLYGDQEEAAIQSIFRALKKGGVALSKGRGGAGTSSPRRAPRGRNVPVRAGFLVVLLLVALTGVSNLLSGELATSRLVSVLVLMLALPPTVRLVWRASKRRARETFTVTLTRSFGAMISWPAIWVVGIVALAAVTDEVSAGLLDETAGGGKPGEVPVSTAEVEPSTVGLLALMPPDLSDHRGTLSVYVIPNAAKPSLDVFLDPEQSEYPPLVELPVTSNPTVFLEGASEAPREALEAALEAAVSSLDERFQGFDRGSAVDFEGLDRASELRLILFDMVRDRSRKKKTTKGTWVALGTADVPIPTPGPIRTAQLSRIP